MFTKYVKQTDDTKVLLLYLLLNGYNVRNIRFIEEAEENRDFGLKVKKLYGITTDYVNIRLIEKEIERIQNPIICSIQSYEYYCDADVIYSYERKGNEEKLPLWINDLNIISNTMIISEEAVVSSKRAKPLEDCKNKGFMFFYKYVLEDEFSIGKWKVTYKDKTFSIFYTSSNPDNKDAMLVFSAIEVDKTSTYKMAIYVIMKASQQINEWKADSYNLLTYEKVVTEQC